MLCCILWVPALRAGYRNFATSCHPERREGSAQGLEILRFAQDDMNVERFYDCVHKKISS